jgi:diguanylate cyclase (GGDEF)-like protein/PAS domain S-box-containing protein
MGERESADAPFCPVAADESTRQAEVRAFGLLDTDPEAAIDQVTRLTADRFAAPIALVSLIERHRQWFKSAVGLAISETPRDQSFCAYLVCGDEAVQIVPDTLEDPKLADSSMVTGPPGIRFYAGVPLVAASGQRIGALCVCDTQPRPAGMREEDVAALKDFGDVLMGLLQWRRDRLELVQSERRIRDFAEIGADWFWEQDHLLRFSFFSTGLEDKIGETARELIGATRWGQPGVDPDEACWPDHRATLEARLPFRDFRYTKRVAGRLRYMSISGRPLLSPTGDFLGYRGVGKDVTREVEVQDRITHLANHDLLTGLPNRLRFHERVAGAIDAAQHGRGLAVLCLDLDRLKEINDTLGHAMGDAVLVETATRLRRAVSADHLVARLGGDEFVIVLSSATPATAARGLARRLFGELGRPYRCNGQETHASFSMGVALFPEDASDAATLTRRAALALEHAKAAGRGLLRFFDASMDAKLMARRDLERDLRRAFAARSLAVHYQPQVELQGGRLCGFEALLRWYDPQRGNVPPKEFIGLAEETGLILALGEWVLERACRDAAGWERPLQIAVNLSPAQFRDGDLVQTVARALQRSGLDPSRLELEITEGLLLEDGEDVRVTLDELKALGVQVVLDDFGTGYSSLSYLWRYPFDKLKIDRSFIQNLVEQPNVPAIVRTILGLGDALNLTITAEGVETDAQADRLVRLGCRHVQGFLFGMSMPAANAARLAAA